MLGRARRRVLVLDSGAPRNYATHEMHGVLGHDGLDPADLRARGRAELARYGVDVVTAEVQDAEVLDGAVRLTLGEQRGRDPDRHPRHGDARRGPDIPGFAEVWGTSAHTCPYCDGFEHRDERLAVLAAGARGEHLAVLLRQWSPDVVLLSNGPHDLAADQLARVQALGIPLIETPVVGLDSDEPGACAASGSTTGRRSTATRCSSTSAGDCAPTSPARSGASCATTAPSPSTPTKRRPSTASTPPATAPTPARLVPAAAGSGVTAAVAINARLSLEDADQAVADPDARRHPLRR